MCGRLPDFLIVGAMKCGTTALATWLAGHPEVHVPEEKELFFFDDRYERGLDWYREQFARAGPEAAIVGEASPSYMAHPLAPARIAEALPGVRLIVLARDPVDRAYSHYQHWRRRKGYERRPFAEAVESELGSAAPWEIGRWAPTEPEGFHYLARGRYLAQIERLLERHPPEAVHVVLQEDLDERPAETFAAVCRFLGIDDRHVPPVLGERVNAYYEFRLPWLWWLLVLTRAGRWLPRRVGAGLYWWFRRDLAYEPMDATVRRAVAEHFAEDNAALGRWLGRDLSHWGAPAPPP